MKIRIPIVVLSMVVAGAIFGQTTYHYEKLKSGEGKMKKGQKEGSWKHWNYMGFPSVEANYKEGKLNGKATYYHSDYWDSEAGTLEAMVKDKEIYNLRVKRQKAFEEFKDDWNLLLEKKFFYVDKVIHYTNNKADTVNVYKKGKFKEQMVYPTSDTTVYIQRTFQPASYKDSINQIIEEQAYKNNKKNGAYKKYNTKYVDVVMSSGFYMEGRRDSIWVYESSYDNTKTITRYRDGKYHGLYLRTKGETILDSMLYLNDKKEGLCKTFKKNYSYSYKDKNKDTTWTYANYTKGKLDGPQISYIKGVPTSSCNYVNGKRDGKEIIYKDGALSESTNYVLDKREGEQLLYHENGNLKSKGYFKNDRRDSTWQRWNSDKQLRSSTLYRDGKTVKEDEYYEDGKLRYHYDKKGENSLTVYYYSNGKKRKQTEITPDKETITRWDENGKKEVDVKEKKRPKKYYDEDGEITKVGYNDKYKSKKTYDTDGEDEEIEPPVVVEEKTSSKYDKYKYDREDKYGKKDKEEDYDKAEFIGGEKKQTEYLNLMTRNDRREFTGGFPIQAAVTISDKGEITYVKVENKTAKKIKKKYLKEAERIVLMMPKWDPAKKNYKRVAENTGFNIWFSEK
jgi:antitoxin component YwqK of YwqJK toxin-antitoxin module